MTSDYEQRLHADYSGGFHGLSSRMQDVLAPRIGDRAAKLYVKAWRKLWWGALLTLLGALLATVGGLASISGIWIGGIGLWICTIVVAALGFMEMRSSRHIASEVLGTRIRINEPPLAKDKYLAWCDRKGVKPFSAADRAP
jgi:hypothetical protein